MMNSNFVGGFSYFLKTLYLWETFSPNATRILRRVMIRDGVLRQAGHKVVEACDGAIALQILQMLRFDLVITDFVLPKLDGIKFVEQLHSLEPRMPIIFTTGYSSVISGKAILDEIAEILSKPFELDVLRSSVQRPLRDSAPC
jgi:CheY-like chemotaxis protein